MAFKTLPTLAASALLLAASVSGAKADNNVLFILDGSNSMWGQVDGVAKIETARKTLSEMLNGLGPDIKAGLMAYGHNEGANCEDVQVLAPVGSAPADIQKKINMVTPKGMTPITNALRSGVTALPGGDHVNSLVLISDGEETCAGDPCAAAAEIAKKGVNLTIHVVGFDVKDNERTQLQCIANAGGGKYFDAATAADFQKAVSQVSKQVKKPEPPKQKVVFKDDFDGETLSDAWEVKNPNPDGFVVEEGVLLGITGTGKRETLSTPEAENVFVLKTDMPKGDWTATAKISVEFSTAFESFTMALFKDPENWIGSQFYSFFNNYGGKVMVSAAKTSRAKLTANEKEFFKEDGQFASIQKRGMQPILLRLEKKGRSFTTSAKLDDMDDWVMLDKVSSLRARGNLAFAFTQHTGGWGVNKTGETLWKLDWVKVEAPE